MTTHFLQSNLWDEITFHAKQAKHCFVAVAYLGKGALDLLPLKRGDVLVVDMSLPAMRSGQTNPFEISKYMKRGVEVHSYANLHAKVFVFDGRAIVGSSNASHNSSNNLVEAAILTSDKDVVHAARGFVRTLMGEQVTPAYLRICKKNYRPPRIPDTLAIPGHPTLWVQRNSPLTREDSRLKQALEHGLPKAKKKLRNRRLFEPDWTMYGANTELVKRGQEGDFFVLIWLEENGRLMVYPPSRITNFESCGSGRKIIFLESPKSPKCIKWKEFRKVLKRGGISKPSENMHRAITDPELKHLLLGLWPTVHN